MKNPLYKISIRKLKIFFRFIRHIRKKFPVTVIALFTLIAVIGAFIFFVGTLEMLRWYVEREIQNTLLTALRVSEVRTGAIERTIKVLEEERAEGLPQRIFRVFTDPFRAEKDPVREAVVLPAAEPLTLSSFTDLFSGTGWIDEARTTLFHDQTVTAFTFPPRFEAERIAAPSVEFRERRADGSDMVCMWNDCLVERADGLFFAPFSERHAYADARYRLALPASVASAKITSLSIGRLETVWLVGVVVESAGEYEGRVFTFDGSTAQTAGGARYREALDPANAPLRSRYPGTLGFGGADRDWLVVYGGYEGIAYRVRANNPLIITDHSKLLGIRVMENGFQPAVLRVPVISHQSSVIGYSWYVWSLTVGKPKFIKLFEDEEGNVAGALDLTRAVFPPGTRRAALMEDDAGRLIMKFEAGSGVEWREFRDLGFVKTTPIEVVSKNLNTYDGAEVRAAKIVELDASRAGGAVELSLSNNGETWLPAEVGKEITFPNASGTLLLWRARVAPAGADEYSPFLDRINLQFKVKFR